MHKIIRFASLGAIAFATLFAAGCECEQSTDADGNTISVCESVVRFDGEATTRSLSYVAGDEIRIEGVNGNIKVTSGGTAGNVTVTFQPFSLRGHSKEDEATRDMSEDLVLETDDASGRLLVKVSRKGGASSGLGADITVTLPSSYSGGVYIDAGNGFVDAHLAGDQAYTTIKNDGSGDIDVTGAAGRLDIKGKFDLDVGVSSWSGDDGAIESTGQLGNVSVTVPSGADGSIQAQSEDEPVVEPSAAPADWNIEAAGESSKTFTFGAGTGGNVTVKGAKQVTIQAG